MSVYRAMMALVIEFPSQQLLLLLFLLYVVLLLIFLSAYSVNLIPNKRYHIWLHNLSVPGGL